MPDSQARSAARELAAWLPEFAVPAPFVGDDGRPLPMHSEVALRLLREAEPATAAGMRSRIVELMRARAWDDAACDEPSVRPEELVALWRGWASRWLAGQDYTATMALDRAAAVVPALFDRRRSNRRLAAARLLMGWQACADSALSLARPGTAGPALRAA